MTAPPDRTTVGARLIYGFLLSGIALMVGGELLCFFGPERRDSQRDIICHVILYCGLICILAGIISFRASRR